MPISSKPLLVVLLGPTASGKTGLAIELAEVMGLAIHNADSRQIYKGMDIGTAKPTPQQQKRVDHYLIDFREPDQPITLQEFKEIAQNKLEMSLNSKGIAFLVGGSGLYIKTLTKGLQPPAVPPQNNLRNQLNILGQNICHQLLETADPKAAARISKADASRTQRALEVIYATGQPISTQQSSKPPPWRILELGLDPINLRQRIAKRTRQLYEDGLIEETEKLSHQYGADLPMLQTIGYKEALKFLTGQLSLHEAISVTTRRTQQYAKRQRTWFRKQHDPYWLKSDEPLREALSVIKSV